MNQYYLRIEQDYLTQAKPYPSLEDAHAGFAEVASYLARVGQYIQASVHVGDSIDEIVEYPDYLFWYCPNREESIIENC